MHERDSRVAREDPSTGRWSRVKALFLDVLDLPAPERADYLSTACAGDEDLRREVEALLESDAAAGSFCETPATRLLNADAQADPSPRLQAGARLGPYEILNFVGAGGMGEVYRARDTRLARIVAVKVVGGHLDDITMNVIILPASCVGRSSGSHDGHIP